jgi:hypothetical protein
MLIDPPATSGAVNVVPKFPEDTSRFGELDEVDAGNWLRIEDGTVKVPCPAVVMQTNVVLVDTPPEVKTPADPVICR